MPGSENRAHYRTSSPQATFMESVSDFLVRNNNTSGLLEVDILKGCASAHSCTKEQILLRVSGSFKGLSGSADVTTHYLSPGVFSMLARETVLGDTANLVGLLMLWHPDTAPYYHQIC